MRTHAEVAVGLASSALAADKDGVGSLGRAEGKLVKGEGWEKGRVNVSL